MKTFVIALAASALLAAPVYAQETKTKADKPVGRNEALKKTFQDLAAKDSAFVVKVGGEAYGVWLWLITWPTSAAWLLAEQLELIDLRYRVYPDLPLGPPSEHLLPGR